MASKLLSSPQTQNILQPKRLNTNSVPPGSGSSNPIAGSGSVGDENHFVLTLTPAFPGKEGLSSTSPVKTPLLQSRNSTNNDLEPFTMSGTRVGAKGVTGNQGTSKKGVVTMAKRNARERNRVKQVNKCIVFLRFI